MDRVRGEGQTSGGVSDEPTNQEAAEGVNASYPGN